MNRQRIIKSLKDLKQTKHEPTGIKDSSSTLWRRQVLWKRYPIKIYLFCSSPRYALWTSHIGKHTISMMHCCW
ncbi:hypothetical protein AFLA_001046 [Aspergillus flavus NRRL3357]|nr:hypothetical protein AFLA_001046 [Aspergillus flavus NRRL3357]